MWKDYIMYCGACQQEKEEVEFISKRGNKRSRCNQCERGYQKTSNSRRGAERRKREREEWKNKNPDYFQKYRKENHAKRCEYNKKWIQDNRERYLLRRKTYREGFAKENPLLYKMMARITSSFTRILKVKKSQTCLFYTGCSSVEDFIKNLSEKTDNPNWIQDGWQIDHIWQLNWFKEVLKRDENAYIVVSNHVNLRPLSAKDNLFRSPLDFSPIKKEDFAKYEPYLNEEIKLAILFYFENEFSGEQINKGSQEEKKLLSYMESIGKLPNFYKGLKSQKQKPN